MLRAIICCFLVYCNKDQACYELWNWRRVISLAYELSVRVVDVVIPYSSSSSCILARISGLAVGIFLSCLSWGMEMGMLNV